VALSLFPFGVSTLFALAAWEGFEGLASAPRLAIVVASWIVAFAAATMAFWKVAEALARRP
jgi:lipopolysaccharide export LptBFGC system permease protein LptF